jgi:hypothetical protein
VNNEELPGNETVSENSLTFHRLCKEQLHEPVEVVVISRLDCYCWIETHLGMEMHLTCHVLTCIDIHLKSWEEIHKDYKRKQVEVRDRKNSWLSENSATLKAFLIDYLISHSAVPIVDTEANSALLSVCLICFPLFTTK